MAKIINTKTLTVEEITENIVANRYTVDQLTAETMGTAWGDYVALCDRIAALAYNHTITGTTPAFHTNNAIQLGGAIRQYAREYLNCNIILPDLYATRVALACVQMRRHYSDDYRKAQKALNTARESLTKWDDILTKMGDNDTLVDGACTYARVTVEEYKDKAVKTVERREKAVDKLRHTDGHVWNDPVPLMDRDRIHATAKCRKLLEDMMSDIATERSMMTVEDMAREQARKRADKKAAEQAKKDAAKAMNEKNADKIRNRMK